MSSTYGENLHLTIFGQSHSPAIGVTVEGIPAGEKVDLDELQRFLNRRAPGKNVWSTPRKEADAPEILSGLVNGYTCGAPLTAIIRNYGGGPVGLETLAATIGEEAVTLEDLCEPYLMQMGFLTRTPRGRCVTQLAYEHLHLPAPQSAQGEQLSF